MSLLESCLTLAIISTVSAIAIPGLSRAGQSYLLTSAASDVATRLQSARINAVIRNCDCRLSIISSTKYIVECENPGWTTLETATLPANLTISANAKPEFHPHGNVAPAGTVTLWNSAGGEKQIIVNIAGRIRIQ